MAMAQQTPCPPLSSPNVVGVAMTTATHATASGSGASSRYTRTTQPFTSSSDVAGMNNPGSSGDDRAGSESVSGADDRGHTAVTVGTGTGGGGLSPPGGGGHRNAETLCAANQVPIIAERFKTKLCKKFEQTGRCPYASKCMFAHGERELRTVAQNVDEGIVSQIAVYSLRRRLAKCDPDSDANPADSVPAAATNTNTSYDTNFHDNTDTNNALGGTLAMGASIAVLPGAPPLPPHWQMYHNHHAYPAAAPQLGGAGPYTPSMLPMPPMLPMPQPFPPPTTQPSSATMTPPAMMPLPHGAPHVWHHHYHAHHALPHSSVWPPPVGPCGAAFLPPPRAPVAMPASMTTASGNSGTTTGTE